LLGDEGEKHAEKDEGERYGEHSERTRRFLEAMGKQRRKTENLSKRNPCPEVRDAKLNRQPDRSYIRRISENPRRI